MKVALGHRMKEGPWGGGNRFARALVAALEERGDTVVFDLKDRDIDAIVLTDPRVRSPSVTFGAGRVLRYLRRHPETVVVHRINECDERKGTRWMNRRLRLANYAADHTVFIAGWLKELEVWTGEGEWSVVQNGADPELFHPEGGARWDGREPLRLVTHHWGGNRMKGLDIYQEIDRLIGTASWGDKLAFTYIGNLPQDFAFTHARHVPPLDGEALPEELRRHHAYVTASVNEPAGMHHIEGALCGLPLIYRESGALPEYCAGFGEPFTDVKSFHRALGRVMQNYAHYKERVGDYNRTARRMCAGYLDVIDDLVARRKEIAAARRPLRKPLLFLLNQFRW